MRKSLQTPLMLAFFLGLLAPQLVADETIFVRRDSSWRYFRGLEEASPGDVTAWRQVAFDDDDWAVGATPIGYGESPLGTDLAQQDPPMRNNYTCVFLRRLFQITDPSRVDTLQVNVDYDDGFVLWINGVEVVRDRVGNQAGDPVAFDDTAEFSRESGSFVNFDLPDPSGYLQPGVNVLAVQAFNISQTSTDFLINVELLDPFGPDVTPPFVERVVPTPDVSVRNLDQLSITFSEDVSGVDAGDIIVADLPAATLSGEGSGPYVFGFPAQPDGEVVVRWAADTGIQDFGDPPNAFGGAPSWSYTVDSTLPAADLVISEVVASNSNSLLDADRETPDWLEIHNRGFVPVEMTGWSLTDDRDDPGRWVFPALVLEPQQYLVVFASGKDPRPPGAPDPDELHTNFQLSASGEYLGLYNAESPRQVIFEFAPRFPEQRTDIAYGVDDTGRLAYFDPPTPGQPNGEPTTFGGFVVQPICNPPRGFFDSPLSVTIASRTRGATIRYTLDGSEPTPTEGTLYTGPVTVGPGGGKGAVALRAIAYLDGMLPSEVVTHTYIFISGVMTQSTRPAGFPTVWRGDMDGNQDWPADYGMDQRVVNDPGHQELIRKGLTSLPTLSVVTHNDNLFDPRTGIYVNSSREGVQWERPASAELIFPDGSKGFAANCGIRIQGGSSVNNWKVIKFSMRLLFKSDYGPSRLRYPLFPDSPLDSFNTIVLDAHMNQTWQHPSHSQRVRAQYCRDQYVSDLQNAAGGYAPHDVFAHLYLNGIYWGVFDLHERPDESFAADYFGGAESEYDILKHDPNNIINGSRTGWNTMMGVVRRDMRSNENYDAVWNHLDVEGLIDYMIVNIFCGNDDWDHHNWYASQLRVPGGLWRFHSWDAEHSLKDVTRAAEVNENNNDRPSEIYSRLRLNDEFRLLFADHVHRHFFNGGMLYVDPRSPDWSAESPQSNRPASFWMRRIDEADGFVRREIDGDSNVGSAIACEAARWGDTRRSNQPYTRNNEWRNELNWLLNTYFPRRSGIVLNQFKAVGLYPRVDAPVFNQHGGLIQPGFALTMTIPEGTDGTIYYTLDGTDPRVFGTGAVSPTAVAYSEPVTLDDYTEVRARVLSEDTWSAVNDAVFTLVEPEGVVRLTEVMYNPSDGPDYEFIELLNTADVTVSISGAYSLDGIQFLLPPGTTMAAGEHLVLVSDPVSFAERYPGVRIGGVFDGQLSNGGENLEIWSRSGLKIAEVRFDDEEFWPLGPDGFGYSLTVIDPFGDLDNPMNWRASHDRGGSPGRPDPLPVHGRVLINEVLTSSQAPLEDAVELYNPGPLPVSVGGWFLSDDRSDEQALRKYRIPDGLFIGVDEYLVLYEGDFNADPDAPESFALDSAGDDIYLTAAYTTGELTGYIVGHDLDAALDGVTFGRHSTSNGLDFTALAERTLGHPNPASVEEFREGGGAANTAPYSGAVVINEIHYHPPTGVEFLELYNQSAEAVALHDAASGRGWRISGIQNEAGTESFEFAPGTVIPAGGYLLVVPVEPATYRSIRPVPAEAIIVGPYRGALDNSGERLRLRAPVEADENEAPHATIDHVRFNDRAPWPTAADGEGYSLERASAAEYGNEPLNWEASLVVGGTPGAMNSVSGPDVNRPPRPSFILQPRPDLGPLAITFDATSSVDPDGEIARYAWSFGDGRTEEGDVVTHSYATSGEYAVQLTVTDDGGAAASILQSFTLAGAGQEGYQVPGDENQDGLLNISDAVSLLTRLFIDGSRPLPCEPIDINAPGNRTLLDINADDGINLTDGVYILNYLFLSGPEPALGTGCVRIAGCPDMCAP